MTPIRRLLKELKGKLESFPDTERDIENINSFLSILEEGENVSNLNTLVNDFRKTSELNKQKRREVLKMLSDNSFYFGKNFQESVKKQSLSNRSDKELVVLLLKLKKMAAV